MLKILKTNTCKVLFRSRAHGKDNYSSHLRIFIPPQTIALWTSDVTSC